MEKEKNIEAYEKGTWYFQNGKNKICGADGKLHDLKEMIEAQALTVMEIKLNNDGKATQEVINECKVLDSLVSAYKVIC